MGKHKDGKKHKKGSQFVIRVDKTERDAFVSLCDALDTSAAREIRRFMRDWVAANTPQPADDHQSAEEPKTKPDAAPVSATVDIALVQAGDRDVEAAGSVSATEPSADVAKEVKPRRKAAKRQ